MIVAENMVKSNLPACVRAQVRYNRRIAPGELCSASWCFLLLSLSLSQSNIFLLVQMHSGLANTLKTESLKHPHLDTQLTHSLLISSYIIFFCTVCYYVCIQDVGRCLNSCKVHMFVSEHHHMIKNSVVLGVVSDRWSCNLIA